MPFDRKIEPVAMRVVRARIALDEAQQILNDAEEAFKALIPEGEKYVTKDGETISHAKGSVVFSPIAEALKEVLVGKRLRFWKAIQVDAVDSKKLNGYIDAGELDKSELVEAGCFKEIVRKSSIRVNFPSTKSLVA